MALDPRDGAVVVAYGTPLVPSPPTNQQAAARTLSPGASEFSAPSVLSSPGNLDESSGTAVAGPGGVAMVFTTRAQALTLNVARRTADGG